MQTGSFIATFTSITTFIGYTTIGTLAIGMAGTGIRVIGKPFKAREPELHNQPRTSISIPLRIQNFALSSLACESQKPKPTQLTN
jgi:hypothetical protein